MHIKYIKYLQSNSIEFANNGCTSPGAHKRHKLLTSHKFHSLIKVGRKEKFNLSGRLINFFRWFCAPDGYIAISLLRSSG